MAREEFTDEQIQEAIEDLDEEKTQDTQELQLMGQQEFAEGFAPEPEERMNAHTFLHKAVFDQQDTLKTTFLTEGELGRPDFSARFLLSIKTVAEDLIDPLARELGLENGIAHYFGEKVENITSSGLSNKGFSMNINVTRKMDATRKKVKEIEPLVKGGKGRI